MIRITLVDQNTNQLFDNRAVQISIRDTEDSTYEAWLTLRSNQEGAIVLDEKYNGKQLSVLVNGVRSAWIAARDQATLEINVPSLKSLNTRARAKTL